mgnify:FL=1|jgi:hypothetical protein
MSNSTHHERIPYKLDLTLIDLSEVVFMQVKTDAQQGAWIDLVLRNGVTVKTDRMSMSRASNVFSGMAKSM